MSKIHQWQAKQMSIGLLDVNTCIALEYLANVLAIAYSNPVRYNESLDKYKSCRNEKQEQSLLERFPPEEHLILAKPSIIIDSGGRIIVWYLSGAMTGMLMTDMHCTTNSMGNLLNNSITTSKPTEWWTHKSNLYPSLDEKITPRCINISPAWFQQGREKYGFPNLDLEDGSLSGGN
ncbi:uncharacterized protein HD556DRAFT_1451154 [Suillus plorans]|uniref:Uncharacterized protein n=1 Tax=Suillus plorans TaxID=116603 RepID=A0A9P7AB82_9AGAM|nr:uncharacterized protein HD556DRAFT_1451154 [Suillus plorans]KAG1784992.1 hypothetical protein HD556DRAFT_1451154 [Suillus plorans]